MRYSVDIETALYDLLVVRKNISASAHGLPATLGDGTVPSSALVDLPGGYFFRMPDGNLIRIPIMIPALPHVHVVRTGGYTADMVIEQNNIDFDVYAEDQAEAMTVASELCGWVRGLAGQEVGSPCYTSEIMTLPYANPDPRHPTLGRATFKAQIRIRIKE